MRRLIIGTVAGIVMFGCAPRRSGAPWLPGEVAIQPADEARFRESVLGRVSELTSFRGLFSTTARRGDETSSFRQAIVFVHPESLRVEALPSQGALSLHLLVSQRGLVTVIIPGEKRAVRGASSTALFRQHLDLPFREGELMALVSGRVERSAFDSKSETRCGENECTVQRLDGRYVWRFERTSARLLSVSIRDPLKLVERIRVRYADFKEFGGVELPTRITLELVDDGVAIDLEASMVKVNQPIPSALFEVAIPADYSVKE